MSETRVITLLALAFAARPAASQNLQGLEREWKDAAAASARVDSLARMRMHGLLDTVRAGNLIVLTPANLRGVATVSAPRAWDRLQTTYGDEASLPGHRPIVVALYRTDSGPPPYGFPTDAVAVPVAPGQPDPDRLVAQLGISIPQKLRSRFDAPLDRWLATPLSTVPPDSVAPAVFEDLVTSPSPFARGCYVGDLTACGALIGLIAPKDAAAEWYDAAGRRALVRNIPTDPRQQVWFTQCVEQSVDVACLHILHGPDSTYLRPPVIAPSRELIARIAVALGGPQAVHRLLASVGQPVSRRLEVSSRVPLDSLLARWRSTVLAARPTSVVMDPALGWVALAWALALGAFVLGSSKWRL